MAYKFPQPPTREKIQIGWVNTSAGVYTFAGYSCAAWSTTYQTYEDSRVPVYAFTEKTPDGLTTIGNNVYWSVTGTIIDEFFGSRFAGNPVGGAYDRKQNYGKAFEHSKETYTFNFLAGINDPESPFELIDSDDLVVVGHIMYHQPHTGEKYDRQQQRNLLISRNADPDRIAREKLASQYFYEGFDWVDIWAITKQNRYVKHNGRVSQVGRFIRHDEIFINDGSLAFELLQDGLSLETVKAIALPRRRREYCYEGYIFPQTRKMLIDGTRMYKEPGKTTITEHAIKAEIDYVAATIAGATREQHPFKRDRRTDEIPFSLSVMTDLSPLND